MLGRTWVDLRPFHGMTQLLGRVDLVSIHGQEQEQFIASNALYLHYLAYIHHAIHTTNCILSVAATNIAAAQTLRTIIDSELEQVSETPLCRRQDTKYNHYKHWCLECIVMRPSMYPESTNCKKKKKRLGKRIEFATRIVAK